MSFPVIFPCVSPCYNDFRILLVITDFAKHRRPFPLRSPLFMYFLLIQVNNSP